MVIPPDTTRMKESTKKNDSAGGSRLRSSVAKVVSLTADLLDVRAGNRKNGAQASTAAAADCESSLIHKGEPPATLERRQRQACFGKTIRPRGSDDARPRLRAPTEESVLGVR